MAKITNLQLLATYNGEEVNTNISNVNPQAADTDLKTFAQGINDLTQNTYVDTVRVDKTSLADVQ